MSFTIVVPALVPSDVHNSWPAADVVAVNHRRPPALLNEPKVVPVDPAVMSATRVVPADVPSLTHSSLPVEPLFAMKYSLLLTTATEDAAMLPTPPVAPA